MTPLFTKLNLKNQTEILVLNAPESFEPELEAFDEVSVLEDIDDIAVITFALAFVTKQEELNATAIEIAEKAHGDAVIWFAYPKGSSKKYKCDFDRDTGWDVLGKLGFEGVRQVAIDADWSALRFRRVGFIKTMTRDQKRAMTEQGKARVSED
ncbi:MAG: hypothetical protein IGS48_24805 [Oscillatoriales cyanobacterium C42_A2020_001]|nr:hypothetical protein [Leptolyngbyaceae cyanobacterium C42_A2020_001]